MYTFMKIKTMKFWSEYKVHYQYFIQITVSVRLCVCVTEVMHFRVIASAFNEY